MTPQQKEIAQVCLDGAKTGAMTFPEIVGHLMENGFESYTADFRRATMVYYLTDGASIELPMHCPDVAIPASFDAGIVQAAIKEAQQGAPGYTYTGFCEKVMKAGCIGYTVSFPGKRVVYYGRTMDMHVEHFPQ